MEMRMWFYLILGVPHKITQDAVTLQSHSWKSRQKNHNWCSKSKRKGGEKRGDMRVGEDRGSKEREKEER